MHYRLQKLLLVLPYNCQPHLLLLVISTAGTSPIHSTVTPAGLDSGWIDCIIYSDGLGNSYAITCCIGYTISSGDYSRVCSYQCTITYNKQLLVLPYNCLPHLLLLGYPLLGTSPIHSTVTPVGLLCGWVFIVCYYNIKTTCSC